MARATPVSEYAAIEREQEAFDRELPSMLAEHEGEFALFHGGQLIALFPIYEEAYRAGLDRYGVDATFLVSEVKTRAPQVTSYAWESGVMFTH
jgi:hypothetical protein